MASLATPKTKSLYIPKLSFAGIGKPMPNGSTSELITATIVNRNFKEVLSSGKFCFTSVIITQEGMNSVLLRSRAFFRGNATFPRLSQICRIKVNARRIIGIVCSKSIMCMPPVTTSMLKHPLAFHLLAL